MGNALNVGERLMLLACRVRIGDIIVVACVLLFGFSLLLGSRTGVKNKLSYSIYSGGAELVRAPIDKDTTLHIKGFIGETVVLVKKGSLRVLSSPCKDKLCVKAGEIKRHGSVVACVPNGVVIVINGKQEVESITY